MVYQSHMKMAKEQISVNGTRSESANTDVMHQHTVRIPIQMVAARTARTYGCVNA